MKNIHINTIEYAQKMGFTIAEYESGFYGANGSNKFIPLKYYRTANGMVQQDGTLDPVKVSQNFFSQIVRILDWISIKNYKVLKLYGLGDLFPEDKTYQQAIRKAVYKILNEYQRYGIDSEQRYPVTINADVTAEVAMGSFLTSSEFTGSEGWNAINRLSLDKWYLDDNGLPNFTGVTADFTNTTGDSWFKTAISKISSSDPLDIPTVLFMNRAIMEVIGGNDLATDTAEVNTVDELSSDALNTAYTTGAGIYLEIEQVTLKQTPIGANQRKATENETILVIAKDKQIAEKVQFIGDKPVVISTNATVLEIISDIVLALSVLDTQKAEKSELNNYLLKSGATDLDNGYDPVRELQIATLKKVRSEVQIASNSIKGTNATKTITQIEETLNLLTQKINELENTAQIDNKIITYNQPLTNPNPTDFGALRDQFGQPFNWNSSRTVIVDVYSIDNPTKTDSEIVVCGDTQKKPFTIVGGTTTGADIKFNVQIDTTGKMTVTDILPASVTLVKIGVKQLLQSPFGNSSFATSNDLANERQARQDADNLLFTKTLPTAINGITDTLQLLQSLQTQKVDHSDYDAFKIGTQTILTGLTTWKDITANYKTRVWTDADLGKIIKATNTDFNWVGTINYATGIGYYVSSTISYVLSATVELHTLILATGTNEQTNASTKISASGVVKNYYTYTKVEIKE